ncbi:MAG: stage III sporulation AC/AD family protein [Firmicutes bacterium]|jgi:stage III sporulation protein AD|nr:stage III sporulation AC/AD family protein [Bacillota bacterium]MCL5065452.1 stage III sporulation AC/AD family protein [Bacillota bacterium]
MNELLQMVGLGFILVILVMVARDQAKPWADIIRLGGGALMMVVLIPTLVRVVNDITRIAALANIPGVYLGLLLKVVGIAYLTTLAARIAYDSGESGVAVRLELAGKLFIVLLALPLIASVTEALLKMVPT